MLEFAPLLLLGMSDDEVVIPVVFFLAAGVVAIFSVVSYNRRKSQESAYAARLKQLMIERGMSAEEISVVISANPDGKAARRDCGRRQTYDV